MIVRPATVEDNGGLLNLTRRAPMKGGIQLRIDRDPDFFEILRRRGNYSTFVIEDEGKIVGSWSVVVHPVLIDGKNTTLNYLRDLKLDPDYQGGTAIFRLFKFVSEHQKKQDADLHFTIVLKGNEKVLSMLGGRAGLPNFDFSGKFCLNFMVLRPFKTLLSSDIIEKDPDQKALTSFYNSFYRNYQLAPVIHTDHLKKLRNIVLRSGERILAAVSLEDPIDCRKNIVVRYSIVFRLLIFLMRIVSKFKWIAAPPAEGEVMRIMFIKYMAFKGNPEDVYKLLKHVISMAFREKYHFLCAGFHEKDRLGPLLKRFSGLKVEVLSYALSLKKNKDVLKKLKEQVLFEDHPLT